MFLKRCTRTKDGKPHTYWQLVESYRTVRGPDIGSWLILESIRQESDNSMQPDSHISLLKTMVLAVENHKLFKKRVESPALLARM